MKKHKQHIHHVSKGEKACDILNRLNISPEDVRESWRTIVDKVDDPKEFVEI